MSALTRFALVPDPESRPAWLAAAELDADVELPAGEDPVAALDALARRWPGGLVRVVAGERAREAAYAHVLGLERAGVALAAHALVLLDWPDPAGAADARPALVGVDLDWLPSRSLGGGRDCFPSGPAGAGTAGADLRGR